jgi:hypothetical protein
MSNIPVTAQMIRDDWADNADLSPDQRANLESLTDEQITAALERAFVRYEDMWWFVLDSTRSDATDALLGQ